MLKLIIENLTLITSALLSGGLGLKLFETFLQRKKKIKSIDFYNDTKEIIDTIQTLKDIAEIDKVLIFRGGNGGSVPKIGKDYYIKAVFEAHKEKPEVSSLKRYSNITPDSDYISIIIDLLLTKKYMINVPQLKPCLLKDIYEDEEIKYSEIYLLCQTEEYVFFMSISTKQNIDFQHKIRVKLEVEKAVVHIKNILNKHYSGFKFKI